MYRLLQAGLGKSRQVYASRRCQQVLRAKHLLPMSVYAALTCVYTSPGRPCKPLFMSQLKVKLSVTISLEAYRSITSVFLIWITVHLHPLRPLLVIPQFGFQLIDNCTSSA